MSAMKNVEGPLVSVVVPVYNIAEYLPNCIESIINQTYKKLEILLVNDGSMDASERICQEYAKRDNRIKVVNKENGGLVSARKAGITRASGKYVINIDGDDWIELSMIQTLVDRIQRDDSEVVQCGYVDEGKKQKVHRFPDFVMILDQDKRNCLLEEWLRGKTEFGSPMVIKLFRTDVIKKAYANVPDTMSNGEDYILHVWLLYMLCKISSVEDIFYHYRIRQDSLSHYQNGIALMMREDQLTEYMFNYIRSRFPDISNRVLEGWILKRKMCHLRKTMMQYGYLIPIYQFPHIDILLDKHIAIYGAGAVGRDYIMQLSEYTRIYIECWVDKQYQKYNYPFRNVEKIEMIKEREWDYIIIAILDEKVAEEIKDFLMVDYGILEEKIIWKYERDLCLI